MPKTWTLTALLLAIIIITLNMLFRQPNPSTNPAADTVPAAQFQQLTAQPEYQLIDIRTPEEFQSGHLANARNLDFYQQASFQAELAKLDKNQKYLIYCRTANRSTQALAQMKKMGFTQVTQLEGGIVAWQAANLPVVQ